MCFNQVNMLIAIAWLFLIWTAARLERAKAPNDGSLSVWAARLGRASLMVGILLLITTFFVVAVSAELANAEASGQVGHVARLRTWGEALSTLRWSLLVL